MTKYLTPVIKTTFVFQIIAFVLAFVNNIIISRWLGPEMLGTFAIIVILVEVILKVVNPGLDSSALYFISSKKFPFNNYAGTYFINSLIVFLVSLLVLAFLIYSSILSIFFKSVNEQILTENYWAISIYMFAFLAYEFGLKISLGLQQYHKYNLAQVLKPFIYFVLLMAVVYLFKVNLILILLMAAFSWILPAILNWKNIFPVNLNWNKSITLSSLSYGIKVMMSNLFTFLTYRSDILLIGFFLSQSAVGWYYVSVIIAERLLFLTQVTGVVLFPAASSSVENQKKTPLLVRTNLFLVIVGAVLIAVAAPWVIPLFFTNEYVASVLPLILLLPGIAALSIQKVLSADMGARGLPKFPLYSSIINFSLNLLLNLILIPKIGIAGAALSSTISYIAAMILQCYFYKRLTGISYSELLFMRSGDLKLVKSI